MAAGLAPAAVFSAVRLRESRAPDDRATGVRVVGR